MPFSSKTLFILPVYFFSFSFDATLFIVHLVVERAADSPYVMCLRLQQIRYLFIDSL